MDKEIESALAAVEKRFEGVEKRIDDLKWFFGGAGAFLTLWFALLSVFTGINVNYEKSSLLEFEKNLRDDLGKSVASPILQMLGSNHLPLDGQDVVAKFETKDKEVDLLLDHPLRNDGKGSTGKMFVKFYSGSRLKLDNPSTDENEFKYESLITSKYLDPDELPGGLSFETYLSIHLADGVVPAPGRYPFLEKVFYGNGMVAQARFTLVVPANK